MNSLSSTRSFPLVPGCPAARPSSLSRLSRWVLGVGLAVALSGLAVGGRALGQSSEAEKTPNTPAAPVAPVTPASTPLTPETLPATESGRNPVVEGRRLMPNDVLAVRVLNELELSVERRVGIDGTITYPFLEVIKVEGKTPAEVEAIIRDGLAKDYLVNPQVMVDVREYQKQFFSVQGQVNRPGQYEYPVNRKIDVLEAITTAGDFSRLAKKSRIEVRRANEKFEFTEKQLKEAVDPTKKFYVLPNDQVWVDERTF